MDNFPIKGKLSNEKIRQIIQAYKYASNFSPSEKLVDSIINQFWFHDFYNSLISDPVFLEYLTKFLDKKKPIEFNRYEFYSFIFEQISCKNPKSFKNLLAIALRFESAQTDSIKLPAYEKLIDDLDKENQFSFNWMQKNHLARREERDGEEFFIWEHHTLTEYLTAEYIINQEGVISEIDEYLVLKQEGIVALKPSWFGVLRFLLESEKGKEIINWLIRFLGKYPANIEDSISELLVYENIQISDGAKTQIFNLIYRSYQSKILWTPVWARTRLAHYVNKEIYKKLKDDLKKGKNETEIFVHRGNIVSIIEGLLESDSKLLIPKEQEFWKKTLIEFANDKNENGVLQRHSLSALSKFKDETIIPQVAKNLDSRDSLIRDAFLEFCGESAPNSKHAIDAFIKGIINGSDIYARHGLYRITEEESIRYFLSKISENEDFLKSFLKHEDIFDKEGADRELVKKISNEKVLDEEVLNSLKEIIFTSFKIKDFYLEEKSTFLKSILGIINTNDSDFIFEILDNIKKGDSGLTVDRLFWDYKDFLALLLTDKNLEKFFKEAATFSDKSKRGAENIIYKAKGMNGRTGKTVYDKAVKLTLIPPLESATYEKEWKEREEERKKDTYKRFLKQLDPAPGRFLTNVFSTFLQTQKEITEFWTKEDKNKFIKLTVGLIEKIDPKRFTVSIPNKDTRQFTWSAQASYYGDLLSVINILAPKEIKNNRQRIIDFIPFAFSVNKILEFVPKIENKDLSYVNSAMRDTNNDKRYLIPSSYIYIIEQYAQRGCNLPSVLTILKSFVFDKNISESDQQSALEALEYFLDPSDAETKKYLENIFIEGLKQSGFQKKIAGIANALLIKVYKDKAAIKWRFTKIKEKNPYKGFKVEEGEHSVGEAELELDNMGFASPLIHLRDERYLPDFFELLDYSFKVLDKNDDYWNYVNYLWKITIAYIENLKENKSFRPLIELEKYINKNLTQEKTNWLRAKVQQLRFAYINDLGKR